MCCFFIFLYLWTMKPIKFLLLALLCCSCADNTKKLSYYFATPAQVWEECIPLGNGRIGMMSDGGTEKVTVTLNESSVWSGSVQDTDNPKAVENLPEIRRLLFEGRPDEAQELMYSTFVCGGRGTGNGSGANVPFGSYQVLGNLLINQETGDGDVEGYRRELDLEHGISTESFTRGNVQFQRTLFASYTDDVCVIRLSANRRNAVSFSVTMDRNSRVKPQVTEVQDVYTDLLLKGSLPSGTGAPGMTYSARVRVLVPKGGTVMYDGEKSLEVKANADATILIAMGTDYYGDDVDAMLKKQLDDATFRSYQSLESGHAAAFSELMDRVSLDLGHNSERESMPVNERLDAYSEDTDDASLAALYYQFGRYLLISSTRPGYLPPNLQGLWANTVQTPWNGDYHLNINLQMNMWPAETGNLSELLLPFTEFTKSLVPSGSHTAQVFYGARGWTAHTAANVWQFTAPGEHPSWGASNTSAAWLCEHLYNHYLYTKDSDYLADVYPTMKQAALFFVDMLVENPNTGYLVTAPTNSPENTFRLPNGNTCNVCAGSTMDNQIVRELFNNVISAASVLGIDNDFSDTLRMKLSHIKPTTIGDDGRIMEWNEPYEEVEIHHRHVSHLYGLYPANEITVDGTPELADAARKTLEVRGDESTGWSMAWKINFWARLHDGEHAWKLLGDLLHPANGKGVNYSGGGGGSYPNLFCAHPPFQIDGNFGGSAGIAEMLLQSTEDEILLLPALPEAWKNGSFKGLCVRGGAEIDASWADGNVTSVELRAKQDGTFYIKGLMKEPVFLKAGETWRK